MRSFRSAGALPVAALALASAASLAWAPAAKAVEITAGIGSAQAGQTVDVTISTNDLTGLAVYSYQFSMSFNASRLSVVDVLESGTSTDAAGWGDAVFNPGSGTVSVSHAGVAPLSGSGPLLTLRFLIDPTAPVGSNTLTWQSFLFNEGTPEDTTYNGTVTVLATPVITVSPNSAEVVRNETLAFGVSGSVTPPVSWGTTDGAVATIDGTGLLTGVTPGSVRVFAEDDVGLRDTTNSSIFVRGMRVTVGSTSAYLGQSGMVSVTVTDLTGLAVRSGQIRVGFNASRVTPTGVTVAGALLDGYGSVEFGVTGSVLTVNFAGTTDLNGSGALCYLHFDASPTSSGNSPLTLTQALFNETLPAVEVDGSFNVLALPTITVSPNTVTLLAGQTQLFTVSGSPTPPITWSTLDPSIATIDPGGLLTAVSGGVTQVQAVDNIGATDLNSAVTVYDFRVWAGTVEVAPGDMANVPILVDRNVDGLGVQSVQYQLSFNPTHLTPLGADGTGLFASWGPPVTNPQSGDIFVAAAGSAPLGPGLTLHQVQIAVSPSAPFPTDVTLTLSDFLCNEGSPIPQTGTGLIQIRESVVGVPAPPLRLSLAPVAPNPARAEARIAFTVPDAPAAGARVRLAVYGVDGRLVDTLVDGPVTPGPHDMVWDLTDGAGRRVSPGIFFARLEWMGTSLVRKFVTLP